MFIDPFCLSSLYRSCFVYNGIVVDFDNRSLLLFLSLPDRNPIISLVFPLLLDPREKSLAKARREPGILLENNNNAIFNRSSLLKERTSTGELRIVK